MEPVSLPLSCPHCQSVELLSHGKRYAVYPAGCAMILPLPVSMLHQVSAPHDFECRSCGQRFSRRTRSAKVARTCLWLFAICLLLLFMWLTVQAVLETH
jgi:hypothetical protein